MLAEVAAEGLQDPGPLPEREPAQGRAAHLPGVGEGGGDVDAVAADPGDRIPGGGVVDLDAPARRRVPLAGDVALQDPHGDLPWRAPARSASGRSRSLGGGSVNFSRPLGR